NLDLRRLARGERAGFDVGEREAGLEGRRERPARHLPDRAAAEKHGRTVPGDDPVVHPDADELFARRTRLEGFLADEVLLRGGDGPVEVRLARRRPRVDVAAVERIPHLEPERVARGESRRLP